MVSGRCLSVVLGCRREKCRGGYCWVKAKDKLLKPIEESRRMGHTHGITDLSVASYAWGFHHMGVTTNTVRGTQQH